MRTTIRVYTVVCTSSHVFLISQTMPNYGNVHSTNQVAQFPPMGRIVLVQLVEMHLGKHLRAVARIGFKSIAR